MSASMLHGGIIGCGFVSQFHLAAWSKQSGARLIAVCDLDSGRAEESARRYDIPHWFDDAERMFSELDLDFIEICTRPESHEPLVRIAARHRSHILCQKPIAEHLASIDRMIEMSAAGGVRIMVHENWRFRPWYLQMAQEIERGTIGRPVRLRVNAHDFRCLAEGGIDDQPYFAQMPRFILYEMGPHLIDVARHLFGEPVRVYCATAKAGSQSGEDSAHLVLNYDNGRIALLDMNWSTRQHPDDRLEWGLYESIVEGTKGTLRTDSSAQLCLDLPDQTKRQIGVHATEDPRLESYAATQCHFIDCLNTERPFATGIEDNRKTMSIVFSAYESADTGRAIPI